jgi:peroxiredoxin
MDLRLPQVGAPPPNFKLPDTAGETVELAAYPRPVGLVFMRHLA